LEGKKNDRKNTGGPAFPQPAVISEAGDILTSLNFDEGGMTLRDYFMAHAPTIPQAWFKPTMPTSRPGGKFVSEDGMRSYATAMEADRAEGFDGFFNASSDAQEEWDRAQNKALFTQWPAAWADEMIKERNR